MNKTKPKMITWSDEIVQDVINQFLKDHPEKPQPVDSKIRDAMKKVVPKPLWRKYFSGGDRIKRAIHAAQGTTPVKDPIRSKAALVRVARMKGSYKSPRKLNYDKIAKNFVGNKCIKCGKELKSDKPQAKMAHYFRAHTLRGRLAAKRAGLNFRGGRKKRGKYTKRTGGCPYCDYTGTGPDLRDHMKLVHPGETGIVDLYKDEVKGSLRALALQQRAPITIEHLQYLSTKPLPQTEVRFCPECGEHVRNWRKINEEKQ